MFKIKEGFGDLENIEKCWGVKEHTVTFADEEAAKEFADSYYELKVSELSQSQPDWYKSYWVLVTPVS